MQRIRARSLLAVAMLAVVLAALTAGTWTVQKYTIEYLLYRDAVSSGHDWANYLAQNVADLEAIAQGEPPSAESMSFFGRVQKVGRVFRYKIFDRDGRLRLVSDELKALGTDRQNLTEHNAAAARAIAAGKPLVVAKVGKPPNRPPYFAEAYVPVIAGGRTLAIVEAYVDQTEKHALFHTVLTVAALSLSLIMALAFAVPAIAWYWRTREKQRADARIDFLAHHDALTGLVNRARLNELLRNMLAQAAEDGREIALHHVNIDRFKDINDTVGHGVGDLLIEIIARRLCRVASEGDIVARIGGDEFLLVQTGLGGSTAAEQRAQAIARAVREPVMLDGHRIAVTASIGVAIAPCDGESVARLMKSADLALDQCKAEGRDCMRFFSADMDAELQGRLALEKALREGVEHDRFELHYQPLFDLPQRRLAGFEALLRLRSPNGGLISPGVFIPIAEDMGLIAKIGAWALEQACRAATHWPESLTVSVNLSPAQFAAGSISSLVAQALAASGLPAHRLELEITESLLLHDTDAVLDELHKLKTLGVAISMDDFGTGYSSLSYLRSFPFDKIKIDRAFMAAFDGGDRNVEQVIGTIAALGRSLNLRITVEGVENERQLRFVEGLHCDQAQGFHLARPMPDADVAPFILGEFQKALPAPKPEEPRIKRRG